MIDSMFDEMYKEHGITPKNRLSKAWKRFTEDEDDIISNDYKIKEWNVSENNRKLDIEFTIDMPIRFDNINIEFEIKRDNNDDSYIQFR